NQVTIVVENPADFDRKGELVEVDVSELAVNFHTALYILKDKKGVEVPYQLTYADGGAGTLVFPVDMQAGATAAYRLTKGVPAEVKPKTYARYIPERKDDLAWENDLAAYRVYGPALAGEDPGNGTDLWLKRTDELIVDKFYHDELKNGLSYHVDHGQGLDCYKVGRTLGAGGIAPYTSRLWTGNPYTAQKVMFTGPLRSVFMLTYDSARVENRVYRQSVTITVDAGSLMNKAVVRYEGYEGDATPFKLAGGIFLHDGDGAEFIDAAYQAIAYAEEAVSDAGLPSGRNYVAVYMPGGKDAARTDGHLILTADYKPGETFTYYFGGGWSKWKFPSDNDWFKAVERFGRMKKEPLQVTVNKGSAS
ncbi:MAG: DUF4861 domain-containing protein, partial [Tannerellaceae bacterium]|nr:DUF4861 domain-containing protein [Tannerellaceae bacterium]